MSEITRQLSYNDIKMLKKSTSKNKKEQEENKEIEHDWERGRRD